MTRRRLLALLAVVAGGWVAWRRWLTAPVLEAGVEPDPSTTITSTTPPITETPSTATTARAPVPPALSLITRSEWGAAPPNGPYLSHRIERLTVHHTAVITGEGEGPARVRSVQEFHQGPERGWVDIAYHLLIDREGNLYEGRPFDALGDTATDYDTTGHFLPCLLGDFDRQDPTPEQLDALVMVLAFAAMTFEVRVDTLAGHRDYAQTSCPGEAIYSLIEDGSLRAAVKRVLSGKFPVDS